MQALAAIEALDAIDRIDLEFGSQNLCQNPPRLRKVYLERKDPFSLRDDEFKRRYRFNKQTASFIIDLLKEDLQLDPRGRGTSPALQVLTAIRYWGRCRKVQDDKGDIHGLSQPTVSRICARVARALAQHSETFIKMPETPAEQQGVIKQFAEMQGFPTVLGCIGCTHIKIRKYGGDAAHFFINKKGYYSLNVQVVCDASLRMRDIVATWRKSPNDSRNFNESTLKERFERGEFRGRLLGDSGYGLESYLLTPILRPENLKEETYNRAHNATRNCVDRCLGVWKQRFQSLLSGLTVRMVNVKPTVIALAVLHNIAIGQGDAVPENDFNESDENLEDEVPAPEDSGRAQNNAALLQAFIGRYF